MNDTIKSANFDSVVSHDPITGLPVYDRPLRGEDVREMYKMIVSDGIYPNPSTSFQVMEGENDNEVIVKAGFGWVQGCPVWDLSDDVVELDPADENNPRIDLVVLQWNNLLANRWVQKVVITGTASATPSAPALTRTADVYEICLAEIERPAGSSLVIQSEITDTRGDDDLCGWTHGVVDQVDTSTIFNQYASWLSQIEAEWTAWWETQQDQTGYMTTNSEYTNLETTNKKIITAINEIYSDLGLYLPLTAGGDYPLTGDLVIDKGSGQDGYYYSYQDGVVKGRVGYGSDGIYRVGTWDGLSSLGGLLVPTDTNSAVKIFGNNQDIHLMPLGVVNYGVDYAIGRQSGFIVCDNDASHAGGLRRSYGGSIVSYIQQTYTGYMDLWSKQNVQIRCGAGHEQDDNVRFLFGTTGVLTAKGMYTTTRSGSTLVIDSSGAIGRSSSLRKYKKNIEDVTEEQANKGYELRPITYESAIDGDIKERQYGFIAEEVEEVVPELCTYSLEGEIDGVAYERVCALLMKQNQMLKARVDALEKRVAKLEAK